MLHPVETGSLRTNHSDAALWRRLCLAPTLNPQRGIWQKNKGPTPHRDAESVVAAAVSGQGNNSQTASLTRRWFDSPAGV